MEGFPTPLLTDVATVRGASLVAVASSARSAIGAIFGGSVARSLGIESLHSVLVAREEVPAEGPLRVVFATDQSPYCNECMNLLVSMAPKGIAHLTLLTVYDKDKHDSVLSLMKGVDKPAALNATQTGLESKGTELAEWLTTNGIPSASKVEVGRVEEVLHKVMVETQADLLIVGSRGHGLLDRIVIGSTCLHEIVHEKYPVLLLRPRT
jgi:nucleotide-binding universal stress UspA family protein